MLAVVGLHLLPVLKALAAHGAAVAVLVLVLGLDMAAQRVARLEAPGAAGLNARQLLRLVLDGVLAQPRLVPELLAANTAHHCGHFKSFAHDLLGDFSWAISLRNRPEVCCWLFV